MQPTYETIGWPLNQGICHSNQVESNSASDLHQLDVTYLCQHQPASNMVWMRITREAS